MSELEARCGEKKLNCIDFVGVLHRAIDFEWCCKFCLLWACSARFFSIRVQWSSLCSVLYFFFCFFFSFSVNGLMQYILPSCVKCMYDLNICAYETMAWNFIHRDIQLSVLFMADVL